MPARRNLKSLRFNGLRFRSLTARLATLYGGLFAGALVLVAAIAQTAIVRYAEADVQRQIIVVGNSYDRVWALRSGMLAGSVDIMARDFGFRMAVASGDRHTMASALANLAARAQVDTAFILSADGAIVGQGRGAVRDRIAALAPSLRPGGGVLVAGGAAWRLVVAPVYAPDEIGKVVLAVQVDRAELIAMRALAAIPLSTSIVERRAKGSGRGEPWRAVGGVTSLSATAARAAAAAIPPETLGRPYRISIGGDAHVAAIHVLPSPDGGTQTALMLTYPLASAVAAFRSLQLGVLLAGIAALLLVTAASWFLARGIARPIRLLDDAARALEAGERREVPVNWNDEFGRLAGSFNAMVRAINEREDRIAHLAFYDALTGLPNRVLFREQLDVALKHARARHEDVALFCVNLDGFKTVNDTLGHGFGDELLKTVAAMIVELAPGSLVARLGGDEFAIILSDPVGPAAIEALAKRIVRALADPVVIDEQQAVIGGSVGVAVGPVDGADADTLLKNADLSLGRAKSDGRGVARFFEPALDAEAQARRRMELDLREALVEGQFVLAYQPIFDSRHERIVCFEALLRWRHPVNGLISPDRFIPLAEECGLMTQIGGWVLREACKQARDWPEEIRIAVNVSPTQFSAPGLNAVILQALANSGLSPARLEIEITESIFLEGSTATIAMLHGLRALGIRIALDDFGIGYSSLSYLRRFPFDKIKIDRSFVGSLGLNSPSAAIIDAIVRLARALGMETTAEGVETADQLEQMRAQGCSSVQGFLFSRPVSALEARILARGSAAMAA